MSPKLDPLTVAAYSLVDRPGAYAVLAGSGVSSGAGIPTAWHIVDQLVRGVSRLQDPTFDGDVFDRYRQLHGVVPSYSDLVEALGATTAERQALVTSFLLDQHGQMTQPGPAHRGLARLVAGGQVKVILTTNFDPLIETALTQAGVDYTVLATTDAIQGALPLTHLGPVVVKLHGDYRDPKILNTATELAGYPRVTNKLLDKVLDEYGLIVCGWSGEHDPSLRAAIDRATNRRFTTYWTARRPLPPESQDLVKRRQAQVIRIIDADDFFGRLADGCAALAELRRPDPLSVAAAVSTTKRQLAGAEIAISAHDTLTCEIGRVRHLAVLSSDDHSHTGHDQRHVLATAFAEMEILTALTATIAYWGTPHTDRWWLDDIGRFARPPTGGGTAAVMERPRLPGVTMAAAAGVAAIAAHRDDLLHRLFHLPEVTDRQRSIALPPAVALNPTLLNEPRPTARMFRHLQPIFVDHLLVGEEAFIDAWDHWQYLIHVAANALGDVRHTNLTVPTDGIRVDGLNTTPVASEWLRAELLRLHDTHPLIPGIVADVDAALDINERTAATLAQAAKVADLQLLPPGSGGTVPTGRHYPGTRTNDAPTVFGQP
ncbi:MAG: SIR2 family protein [Actinomycetota bacterium]|nr:SIR2 family protein [Actinomycetota bacterium]